MMRSTKIMTKNLTEARSYFKQIKQRLATNDYRGYNFESEVYYVNNRKLTQAELEIMSDKVKGILASQESVDDTLFRIIPDEEEYYNMDEISKTRYILELSKIYNKIKTKLLK
jgi:CYTH domain-containing protein